MADGFWEGFDFPSLDGDDNPVQEDVTRTIDDTPDISTIETNLVKRAMVVFFVVDTSGSMHGDRIGAVNDAVRTLIPELKKREASNTNAQIKIALLMFNAEATWATLEPQPVSTYNYSDINQVGGATNYGNAFDELNKKLSRSAFLKSAAGAYTPLIIFMTDGKPTDVGYYKDSLNQLKHNAWFNYATKAAIAIGKDAIDDPWVKQALTDFTANEKMVLAAKNTNILTKQIELVTLTGVDFVTQQGSLQNASASQTPDNRTSFGSNYNGAQQPSAANNYGDPEPVYNPGTAPGGTVGAAPGGTVGAAPGGAAPGGAGQSGVDVTAGANPSIPGLGDIDWENDFKF